MNIIQELKPLRYKDSVPKLLSYRLAYIPMSEARGFTLAFGKQEFVMTIRTTKLTSKVTQKYQATIPQVIREKLAWDGFSRNRKSYGSSPYNGYKLV